jgi:hypothetical protein
MNGIVLLVTFIQSIYNHTYEEIMFHWTQLCSYDMVHLILSSITNFLYLYISTSRNRWALSSEAVLGLHYYYYYYYSFKNDF